MRKFNIKMTSTIEVNEEQTIRNNEEDLKILLKNGLGLEDITKENIEKLQDYMVKELIKSSKSEGINITKSLIEIKEVSNEGTYKECKEGRRNS